MLTIFPAYIKCEKPECGHVFTSKGNIHTRFKNDIEETIIKCPQCKTETVAVRTDSTIRKLQRQVKSERKKADDKIKKGIAVEEAEKKLRTLQAKLKKKLDLLNKKR